MNKVNKLRNIIDGRKVIVLLHGPSMSTMEDNILKLNDDFCFVSLNNFTLIEDKILNKINQQLDIVMVTAPDEFRFRLGDIKKFLNRSEENLLIFSWESAFQQTFYNFFKNHHLDRLVNIETMPDTEESEMNLILPHQEDPFYFPRLNTLSGLLICLIYGDACEIFLFGADGSKDPIGQYWQDELMNVDKPERGATLAADTLSFNKYFPAIYKKLQSHGNLPCQIINASPNSHINVFPRMSQKEAIEYIKEDKNV